MSDNMSKEKRSYTMSCIRSKGNISTEIRMIELFRNHGVHGWLRHPKLKGNPDFIFKKQRIAVFIDGCFWHGCPRCFTKPKTNIEYWLAKIERNKIRDKKVDAELKQGGWIVLRFWEHSFRRPKNILKKISHFLGDTHE